MASCQIKTYSFDINSKLSLRWFVFFSAVSQFDPQHILAPGHFGPIILVPNTVTNILAHKNKGKQSGIRGRKGVKKKLQLCQTIRRGTMHMGPKCVRENVLKPRYKL